MKYIPTSDLNFMGLIGIALLIAFLGGITVAELKDTPETTDIQRQQSVDNFLDILAEKTGSNIGLAYSKTSNRVFFVSSVDCVLMIPNDDENLIYLTINPEKTWNKDIVVNIKELICK